MKSVKLTEETRILINMVRAMLLNADPKINKLTDDKVIYIALKKYKEVAQ